MFVKMSMCMRSVMFMIECISLCCVQSQSSLCALGKSAVLGYQGAESGAVFKATLGLKRGHKIGLIVSKYYHIRVSKVP
jgi:hypothetical protein